MKESGRGNLDLVMECRTLLTIRTEKEFMVVVDEDIVAPNSNSDRYAQITVEKDQSVHLTTKGAYTVVTKELPKTKEEAIGESLVENIPEGEMSIYDRLRAEMLGTLSRYAEERGMDSYEEDDDYEFEDDDEGLIDTPYEYAAMKEEYLDFPEEVKKEIAQNPSEEIEIKEDHKSKESKEEKTA